MANSGKIEIRNTANTVVTVINSSTTPIDRTTTSIKLFSKGVEQYLKEVNENFYQLLENFASKKAPAKPLVGQLWYSKKGSNTVEVKGTGLNFNASRAIKINGSSVAIKDSRGLVLVIFDNNFTQNSYAISYYDIYGSDAARTQLATKLKTIKEDQMFILASWDAIGTNSTLTETMKNLGSQAWHKIISAGRYPYASIGTGKLGIISENLEGIDAKKHAVAYVVFESLIASEGMGYHTSVTSTTTRNDNLLVWDGSTWNSSAATLDGRNLKSLRTYVLAGVDLSVKYDKTGGTINGSVVFQNKLTLANGVTPTGNEIQDIGSVTNRFSRIHLDDVGSIYMGEGKSFGKNSFVYTVDNDYDSISYVPAGSIILNRSTGVAVAKKTSYIESTSNNTFIKLLADRKYGVNIGGYGAPIFYGNIGVWMGSWNHNIIQTASLSTNGNAVKFGTCNSGGHSAGASDGVRGISFYQYGSGNTSQYVTIASPMNAINFGYFGSGWCAAAASNGERALIFGGQNNQSQAFYVAFSTPMNSTYFGELGTSCHWNGAVSDGNKAVFDRGLTAAVTNEYRQVSMTTTGNASYFGKMQTSRGASSAVSNETHALWIAGATSNSTPDAVTVNTVEKLTLATQSNSTYFGNMTYSRHTCSAVTDGSFAVAAGGSTYSTVLDTISFANGGSASKFGDAASGIRYAAAFSGN